MKVIGYVVIYQSDATKQREFEGFHFDRPDAIAAMETLAAPRAKDPGRVSLHQVLLNHGSTGVPLERKRTG